MAKIKLFTHTDLDGVGCAIVAKVYAEQNVPTALNIEFCQNNEVDDAVNKFLASGEYEDYDMCYITDLSVNPETAEKINDIFINTEMGIKLFDHHPTATWLNIYTWAFVETTEEFSMRPICGTKLFYHELFSSERVNSRLLYFVDDVNHWDTWTWQESGLCMPQFYNTMFKILGREAFIEEMMPKLLNTIEISDEWNRMYEREEFKKGGYIEEKRYQTFEYEYAGEKYLVVFASNYVSELGNLLSKDNPDYKGVFLIGEGTVSLRTGRKDVDLSEIAKKFGGGGHKQAAGFVLTPEKKKAILDIIFK